MTKPSSVSVVLDRAYGAKLADLARIGPVWIVDTPPNRAAAEDFWVVNPDRNHLNGVTTFKAAAGASEEDILLNEMDTIDLHHGTFSSNPAYSVLQVIGARLNETVKNKLSDFGFCQFEITADGFQAVRRLAES